MGTQLPPQKRAEPPPIFGPFYCGQTAGCIKMPHGMEEGLSQIDFVLYRDSAPSPKRGWDPNFWPTSIVDKWLHGSRCHLVQRQAPQPTQHCVRWRTSSPTLKGHSPPPNIFWSMSIVSKRLDGLRCHLVWR